jgi:CheY-like chemotaxis protein
MIIMDCGLPGISGYEASKQIKQLISEQHFVNT